MCLRDICGRRFRVKSSPPNALDWTFPERHHIASSPSQIPPKQAKAEYAKRVLGDAMSRRVQVPLAPK